MRKLIKAKSLLAVIGALMFFVHHAIAQTPTIQGSVKDATGQILSGASVQILGGKKGSMTDNSGNYSLTANPGRHIFIVSVI